MRHRDAEPTAGGERMLERCRIVAVAVALRPIAIVELLAQFADGLSDGGQGMGRCDHREGFKRKDRLTTGLVASLERTIVIPLCLPTAATREGDLALLDPTTSFTATGSNRPACALRQHRPAVAATWRSARPSARYCRCVSPSASVRARSDRSDSAAQWH